MKKLFTILGLLLMFGISSCKKVETSDDVIPDIADLTVPIGFTWENSTDIYFDIRITDTRFGNSIHVVSIYDGDPALNGKLLSRGSGSVNEAFASKIYIPNTVKEIFVVKTAPDNSQSTTKVPITSQKLELNLSAVVKNMDVSGANKVSDLSDSPDCTTGCTQTISSSNTNLNVNNGDVVCITGSNITVGFNGNGGTVRICGTNVTVQNASLNNSATLIITAGSSVTFSNLNVNGNSSIIKNYGTTTVNGSFSPKGTFLNEAVFSTTGDFNLNSQTSFTNNGVINVGATMNVNTNSVATNNGAITTTNDFELNSQSDFINKCFLWVKGSYKHNSDMYNYSLIKVNNETFVNGNSGIYMHNGSMLTTASIKLNGLIKGNGTTSLVKVSGNSTINGGANVQNAIQYCDADGIETNNGTFSGGATLACSVFIPVSNCNTVGNGTAPIVDTDGDGVNDPQDEYPNDPTKAYNNYYPSSSPTSGATVAFEDRWPAKGDYDLNDVVMSYRYKIVTNAQNKVVQVNGDYTLHATGGDFRNGFGIEFPIARSKATGLTGGTLETGQTNAVVLLFSNMRNEMVNWNTRLADPVSAVKTYSISFNVTSGPTLSSFGLGSYNPFIWNSGIIPGGRGYETHLPGKPRTTLGNPALYGTGDDNSNVSAGRYYVTSTGLPWAINVPIKPFNYTREQNSINSGYLRFTQWAQSGGSQYPDWYSNTGPGYRNSSALYFP